MTGDAVESVKARAGQTHGEVTAFLSACMAGVQVAVVLHLEP